MTILFKPFGLLSSLTALVLLGSSQTATAVLIDFENPPYVVGPLVGQNGWQKTAYAPTPNGTVTVSTTDPITGSQSLSYERLDTTLAPNFADVVKSDVINITSDGTAAPDLKASFQISSTSLASEIPNRGFGVVGVFLSYAGASGVSPIGLRLNNAGSSIASIEEYANLGGSGAYYYFGGNPVSAAYNEGDNLEFTIDVDFDTSTYTTSYRNLTTGGPVIAPGISRGFVGGYASNPDGTYDVDFTAAFRYGTGQIDNINLVAVPEPSTILLAGVGLLAIGLYRSSKAKA